MKRGILSLITCIALATTALADGWPQPRGHGYYKLGYRIVRATEFYQPDGSRIPIPTLGEHTISFYGEYGLTNRITVLAYIPFFERITLNRVEGRESGFEFFEGDVVTGIADAEAGARIGLARIGPMVLSAGLAVGVPLGDDAQPNGLLTGDGEWNQRLRIEGGYSFYPTPAYAAASAGFNNRMRGFSDEIVYAVEGGYTFAALTLVGRLRGVESLKNGDASVTGGMGGLFANNQRYLAYGAEVIYTRHGRYGLSVAADAATRARNVLAAPAFSVGVFLIL